MELEDDTHDPNLSGSIRGGLSRPGAGPADDVLSAHRSGAHRAGRRRHLRRLQPGRNGGAAGKWWLALRAAPALPAAPAADPVSAEVSALVVRVESRAVALRQPGRGLSGPAG